MNICWLEIENFVSTSSSRTSPNADADCKRLGRILLLLKMYYNDDCPKDKLHIWNQTHDFKWILLNETLSKMDDLDENALKKASL